MSFHVNLTMYLHLPTYIYLTTYVYLYLYTYLPNLHIITADPGAGIGLVNTVDTKKYCSTNCATTTAVKSELFDMLIISC